MSDVVLFLLAQNSHHLVDRFNDFVEVATGLKFCGDPREAHALELRREGMQARRYLVHARTDAVRKLKEGCGRVQKSALRERAGKNLDGLAHALEFFGAEPRAVRPKRSLLLTAFLGVREKFLIGLELRTLLVEITFRLGLLLSLRRLIERVLIEGRLKSLELRPLGGHELLERLLRLGLLGARLLHVGDEGVVHAFQDALDARRLRCVVAKRIVGDLHRTERGRGTTIDEFFRPLDEVLQDLDVTVRHRPCHGGALHHTPHASNDAEQLGFLHRLQKTLAAGACAGQHLDGAVEGPGALLILDLLLIKVLPLLLADVSRLLLRLDVRCNHLLQVADGLAMRGDLSLQLH
mmetsp:Transcript_121270/g.343179  ORF Transcript_121270/g.343179 Transcript_121270/m.343179 type:complete len:350 (-) Transcript_121270:395-1444(-)